MTEDRQDVDERGERGGSFLDDVPDPVEPEAGEAVAEAGEERVDRSGVDGGQGVDELSHDGRIGRLASGSEWVPAFPGQRPPFTPGHELSVTHGVYSPRKVDPLASELIGLLLGDDSLSYLAAPSYRPALWAWARAEARCQLLDEYLGAQVGNLKSARVTSAYRELNKAETRAANLRAQLGLTPLSRARLGKDVAQGAQADAAAALTRMREEAERSASGARQSAEGGGSDG